MKKMLLLAAMFSLIAAAPALADRPDVPADGLDLMGSKPEKKVVFNHSTHKDSDCAVCHHPVGGKENFGKCATAGCHDDLQGKKKAEGKPAPLYFVVHNKKAEDMKFPSCISCHAKAAGEDAARKKELTACKDSKCHPAK